MLTRFLKQSPYLYRHNRSLSFYYRRRVPKTLYSAFNKREIRFSLQAASKIAAMLLHDKITANLNYIFNSFDGRDASNMSDILKNFNLKKATSFEASSIIKNADGSIEIKGYKSDPNNPAHDLEALKMLGFGQQQTQPVQPTQTSNNKNRLRFSELVEKYLKYAELSVKAEYQDRPIFQIFVELYDDIYIDEIDHVLLSNFVETIQYKIPKNAKRSHSKLTAKQITRLVHSKDSLMSAHSVNKYLGRIGMVFKYAKNQGLMSENYAEGKRIKNNSKAREQRRPFSIVELNTLFKTTKLYTDRTNKNKDLFFLNLIGLFTGMRLGEICQLQPQDIRQEDNIWIIDINENHDLKSCKTSGSKRYVPIHNELLKCGFIEFVNERKSKEFIFKWRHHEKNGWSHYSSKSASHFIQSIANIKGQSFHCFRHNVGDCLMKDRNTTKELQEAILGHTHEGESYGRYGKGFALDELKDVIENIKYDGLNLSHLYV